MTNGCLELEWEWGLTANGHKQTFRSDENVLTRVEVMVAQLYKFA